MPSFDVVSKTEMQEVKNAIEGASREISTRYDFKGSNTSIEQAEEVITILADDDLKLRQVEELIKVYFTRRKLDPSCLEWGKPEPASKNMIRQITTVKQGIERDIAKKITKHIKSSKLKVQVAIQGDELRITGKKRDDLQSAMASIKEMKLELPLQYVNMRS